MQLGIEISINLPGTRVKADLNEARMGKGKWKKINTNDILRRANVGLKHNIMRGKYCFGSSSRLR